MDDTVELVDPRGNLNFKEILVYPDPVDKHAKYHEIDNFNMLVEEMKESTRERSEIRAEDHTGTTSIHSLMTSLAHQVSG